MDGTDMDVLMEYIEWRPSVVASRYVRVTTSAAESRGTKQSHGTAFIDAPEHCRSGLQNHTRRSHGTTNGSITPKGLG